MHGAEEEGILPSDLQLSGCLPWPWDSCGLWDQKSQAVFIYLCDLNVPHSKVGAIRFLNVGSGD